MYKCMVLLFLHLLSCRAFATEHPSISDLLDKYRSTQDSMLSFMVKDVTTTWWTDTVMAGQRTRRETSVFFLDGDRVDCRTNLWSDLISADEHTLVDKAAHKSFLWDGQSYFQYKGDATGGGRAFVNYNDKLKTAQVAVAYRGAPLMGICFGDDQRVDSILRRADDISVRDKMDVVGGSKCYVIDAVTGHGKYTFWIDPEHDYNMAKVEVHKKAEDLAWGGKTLEGQYLPSGTRSARNIPPLTVMVGLSFSLENVRFEKVDGVWRPMEADYEFKKIYAGGRVVTVHKHHKRTSIDLHPDFDAERAFIPDIPDGTKVYVEGVHGIQYIWQDGKLIPDIDKAVIDELDKMTEEIMAEGKVLATPTAVKKSKPAPNEPSVVEDTQSEPETDIPEAQRKILSESRSLPLLVLILIGLLIIGVIVWLVFRRLKA